MNVEVITSPVCHHGHIVVFLRPSGFLEKEGTCSGTTAEVFEGRDSLVSEVFKENRVTVFTGLNLINEANVPSATVIGITTSEDVHEGIDGNIVNIA